MFTASLIIKIKLYLGIKLNGFNTELSSPGIMFYKYSFGQEEFLELHLERKNTQNLVETNIVLEPISTTPLPTEKIKDLNSLMPYIHPNSRQYYESFTNNLVEGLVNNIG